jgi:hypothetical protein
MSSYPGGGSNDPLLDPIEGFEQDIDASLAELLRGYFGKVAGGSDDDFKQSLADTLARLDDVRDRLQDFVDNDVVPSLGALPAASPDATIPASPNQDGWENITTDDAIVNDNDYERRGAYGSLRQLWRYVSGTALEMMSVFWWNGVEFILFVKKGSP